MDAGYFRRHQKKDWQSFKIPEKTGGYAVEHSMEIKSVSFFRFPFQSLQV